VRSPLITARRPLSEARYRRRTLRSLVAGMAALAIVLGLLVWVFGTHARNVRSNEASLSTTGGVPATGRPEPLAVATVDQMRLQLPIARRGVTAIAFYSRRESGLLTLEPQGRRVDRSFGDTFYRRFFSTGQPSGLSYLKLHKRGESNAVAIGAVPGSEVYAPVSGTIVAIANRVIDGRLYGHVVRIQPLGDAETIIALVNLEADASLRVGDNVAQGNTLLGRVIDVSRAQKQPLARHTHDTGANLEVSVRHFQPDTAL
jgi:murein DD-endopeptidase MepM/ murein hydrolase activator NlpD